MSNELQLSTGPYRFTATGIERVRESTPQEWEHYGEGLRRIDEAKQWAIGDWLVDGKRHYGDGAYEKGALLFDSDYNTMARTCRLAEMFEISRRRLNVDYSKHVELASLKPIVEREDGKLDIGDEPDYEKIDELLAWVESEKASVRDLREKVKRHKDDQREHIRLANEPEKYTVIYADPPWKYTSGDQHGYYEQHTVIGDHYPSMTIRELCALPVKQIAAENAVLFLWVTSPLLEECFELIRAWGFEYKTSMVWDKVAHNVGNYVSVRHEFLLICTRGTAPKVPRLVDSVYQEERTEHSRKPEYFRSLITELYSGAKRIELFARPPVPDGWDVWGNEV